MKICGGGILSLLDNINNPRELKDLDSQRLPELCDEIRDFLLSNVSKTGGHLASNLGVVELTVGAHRVFSCPTDSIMFDVGHQCYTHKILTGRRDRFDTLRSYQGISGFLRPDESDCDCFISGHASNSISASLGIARAKKLRGDDSHAVCIIGDGAMTGGMAYEALNDAGQSGEPLIVIYNDNEMSIGRNVGALSKRLTKIRLRPRYFMAKAAVKQWLNKFKWGSKAIKSISKLKKRVRTAVMKESIFELMGFRYLGPADGHDIETVIAVLEEAKKYQEPVLVHFKTVKGKGYELSEQSPIQYHGVSAFDPRKGTGKPVCNKKTFSAQFGNALCDLAQQDETICAITAAMEENTGLGEFAGTYRDRFFDVGIAEEHAVTMASGLAAGGMKPVLAIYSTFLQRGIDQIIHDVAIQGNHVVFAVDRAGIVGADGQTHQGIFDVPMLLTVPGIKVFAPSSFAELRTGLRRAVNDETGLCAIRYPRGGEGAYREDEFSSAEVVLRKGSFATLLTYGIMVNEAVKVCESLEKKGISVELIKINSLSDFDINVIVESVAKTGRFIALEDCIGHGCLGESVAARLHTAPGVKECRLMNLGSNFIPEGDVAQIYQRYGIDSRSVEKTIITMVEGHTLPLVMN